MVTEQKIICQKVHSTEKPHLLGGANHIALDANKPGSVFDGSYLSNALTSGFKRGRLPISQSKVAAEGIALFTRTPCGADIVSVALTSGYPSRLTPRLLPSAAWTFLPPFGRATTLHPGHAHYSKMGQVSQPKYSFAAT